MSGRKVNLTIIGSNELVLVIHIKTIFLKIVGLSRTLQQGVYLAIGSDGTEEPVSKAGEPPQDD